MCENQNNNTNKKCKLKNIISGFKNLSTTAKYFWGLFAVIVIAAIFFSIVLFSYSASLEDIKYANISTLLNEINDKLENHLTFESTVTLEDYAYLLDQKLKLENEIDGYDDYTVFNDVLDKMQAQYDGFTGSLSNLLIFVGTIIVIVPILLSIFNYVFLNKDLINKLHYQINEVKVQTNKVKDKADSIDDDVKRVNNLSNSNKAQLKEINEKYEKMKEQIDEINKAVRESKKSAEESEKFSAISSYFSKALQSDSVSEKIDLYSKILEFDPKNIAALNNRGNTYYKKEEYEKAIEDFSKAIELEPENADYYYNRGTTYYFNKEYEKAIEDFSKAIKLNPENARYYNVRGIVYSNTKEYEKAIEDFSKAIELEPENATYYDNRGLAYGKTKEYEKAIEDFSKAIELNPNSFNYYSKANLYRELGKNAKDDINRKNLYNKALSDAKKAIELNPNYSYGYGTLAEIYASMGSDEEFYKNLELALYKKYPLLKAIKDEPDIKELYDKYKDQEEFKELMKKYEIDYK